MLQGLCIFMPVGNKCLYDQGLHHYININLLVTMNFLQWTSSIFISEQSVACDYILWNSNSFVLILYNFQPES